MALLPDPTPRERQHILISVDDHLIEPPDLFDGRMPAALADRAPQVVELDDGRQAWAYEDRVYPQIGLNAVVGRPKDEWSMEPARFDEMRRGCWDIDARIADMDLDGICASLCFPSLIAGFAGTIFCEEQGPRARPRVLRAWNDWHIEEWAGPYPDRIIPLQLAWLPDPQIAADDVRRNAERGFKAVSFPENPVHLQAAVGAHRLLGSVPARVRGDRHRRLPAQRLVVVDAAPSPGAPLETITTLFPVNAMVAAPTGCGRASPSASRSSTSRSPRAASAGCRC